MRFLRCWSFFKHWACSIDEHLRPATLIACFIRPGELQALRARLAERHPEVLVPERALELMLLLDQN